MSTTVTKFETQIPLYSDGTNEATAVANFLTSMETLTTIYTYQLNVDTSSGQSQQVSYFGYLAATQGSTALGYLATLNAALGKTVPCVSYTVSTQP